MMQKIIIPGNVYGKSMNENENEMNSFFSLM